MKSGAHCLVVVGGLRCIRDWSYTGRDEATSTHCIPIGALYQTLRMMFISMLFRDFSPVCRYYCPKGISATAHTRTPLHPNRRSVSNREDDVHFDAFS